MNSFNRVRGAAFDPVVRQPLHGLAARRSSGAALFLALVVLTVSTVLVLSAMRGSSVQESMAGNQNIQVLSHAHAEEGGAVILADLRDAGWRAVNEEWDERLAAYIGDEGFLLPAVAGIGCDRRVRAEIDDAVSGLNRLAMRLTGYCVPTGGNVASTLGEAVVEVQLQRSLLNVPPTDEPLTCNDVVDQRYEDLPQEPGGILSLLSSGLVPGTDVLAQLGPLQQLQVALGVLSELDVDLLDQVNLLRMGATSATSLDGSGDEVTLSAGDSLNLEALELARLNLCLLADAKISKDGIEVEASVEALAGLFGSFPVLDGVLGPFVSQCSGPLAFLLCPLSDLLTVVTAVGTRIKLLSPNQLVELDLELLGDVRILNTVSAQIAAATGISLLPTPPAQELVSDLLTDDDKLCDALENVGLAGCNQEPVVRIARWIEVRGAL